MRGTLPLCVIGLCTFAPGCRLVYYTADNLCRTVEHCHQAVCEHLRDRRWAANAWNDFCRCNPDAALSGDFAAGFEAGFADFLFAGGTGEPPPLPPERYRKLRYQTPEGYRAKEDWFAGFRAGAAAAHDGGYRQWITGPSSFAGLPPFPLPPQAPWPGPFPPPAPMGAMVHRADGPKEPTPPRETVIEFRPEPVAEGAAAEVVVHPRLIGPGLSSDESGAVTIPCRPLPPEAAGASGPERP
jgi:hypothetical protein